MRTGCPCHRAAPPRPASRNSQTEWCINDMQARWDPLALAVRGSLCVVERLPDQGNSHNLQTSCLASLPHICNFNPNDAELTACPDPRSVEKRDLEVAWVGRARAAVEVDQVPAGLGVDAVLVGTANPTNTMHEKSFAVTRLHCPSCSRRNARWTGESGSPARNRCGPGSGCTPCRGTC